MYRTIVAIVIWLLARAAEACSCPLETQWWWDESPNVALVRVDEVRAEKRAPFGAMCTRDEPCILRQVAKFKVVEQFKGSVSVPELTSGYASGDCGIPLVAGTYYVVFLRNNDGDVGFCNSAGPFPMRNAIPAAYPLQIDSFVKSLRSAAKTPGKKVEPRPYPMPYDVLHGQ